MNITINIDVDICVDKAGMVRITRASNNRTTLSVTEGTREINTILEVRGNPPTYHLVELVLSESGTVTERKILTPGVPVTSYPVSTADLERIARKIFSVTDIIILMVSAGLDIRGLVQ